ncbi:MAG: hypothetical protein FJX64_05115 [Alphaproteobacteria bacterium]|nr:hypothetical protein [Alphaproteobacteria bacterium]
MKFEPYQYVAEFVGLPGMTGCATALIETDDTVRATDTGGAIYSGRHEYDAGTGINTIRLMMSVPTGTILVSDGRRRDAPEVVPIVIRMRYFDLGRPVSVQTPYGPVSVVIRRALPVAA